MSGTELSKADYANLTTEVASHLESQWTADTERNHVLFRTEMRTRLIALKDRDNQIGQLLMMLSAADEEGQLRGIGHFVWMMSETGSFRRSLSGACEVANLEAPAEDRGPFDELMDTADERRDNRRNNRPRNNGTGGRLARIRTALTRRV